MTREEAIKFSEYAQLMTDGKPDVQEFYKIAEAALREQDAADTNVGHKSNANQHVSNTSNALGGWISVEERLPDEAVRVLVRLDGNKPPIGEPRMDTDRVVDGRWVRWFDLVTHWMPLPEPPKEEV